MTGQDHLADRLHHSLQRCSRCEYRCGLPQLCFVKLNKGQGHCRQLRPKSRKARAWSCASLASLAISMGFISRDLQEGGFPSRVCVFVEAEPSDSGRYITPFQKKPLPPLPSTSPSSPALGIPSLPFSSRETATPPQAPTKYSSLSVSPAGNPAFWDSNNRDSDSLELFLYHVAQLQAISKSAMKATLGAESSFRLLTPTHSLRDSSYTKSWTHADWEVAQRPCWSRYLHHVSTWMASPTAKAIAPTVLGMVVYTTLILVFTSIFRVSAASSVTSTTVSFFSAPIALLLTLRTNRALDRLLEARGQWGITMRAVTSLAGLVSGCYSPGAYESQNPACFLIGRYLILYCWCLKSYLRPGEDDDSVISTLLPPVESSWLLQSTDHPTAIIFRLRSLFLHLLSRSTPLGGSFEATPTTALHVTIENKLEAMESSLGICKRILGSPIPPTYTRHTSRVLCLYLALVPWTLVALDNKSTSSLSLSSWPSILLNVALTSYLTVGLDEIAVEIENPFPLLPMFHLARATENNVRDQFIRASTIPTLQTHRSSSSSTASSAGE
jgi:ion channel-forming bestrophin family protein